VHVDVPTLITGQLLSTTGQVLSVSNVPRPVPDAVGRVVIPVQGPHTAPPVPPVVASRPRLQAAGRVPPHPVPLALKPPRTPAPPLPFTLRSAQRSSGGGAEGDDGTAPPVPPAAAGGGGGGGGGGGTAAVLAPRSSFPLGLFVAPPGLLTGGGSGGRGGGVELTAAAGVRGVGARAAMVPATDAAPATEVSVDVDTGGGGGPLSGRADSAGSSGSGSGSRGGLARSSPHLRIRSGSAASYVIAAAAAASSHAGAGGRGGGGEQGDVTDGAHAFAAAARRPYPLAPPLGPVDLSQVRPMYGGGGG
jgi:hypothetical protein